MSFCILLLLWAACYPKHFFCFWGLLTLWQMWFFPYSEFLEEQEAKLSFLQHNDSWAEEPSSCWKLLHIDDFLCPFVDLQKFYRFSQVLQKLHWTPINVSSVFLESLFGVFGLLLVEDSQILLKTTEDYQRLPNTIEDYCRLL